MKPWNRFLLLLSAFLQFGRPWMHAADPNSSTAKGLPAGMTEKDREYRLKWNLDTLVGDYEKHGRHNPKWDESAKAALRLFAEVRSYSPAPAAAGLSLKLAPAVRLAVTNGCDDPLVLYLAARFVTPNEKHSWKEHGEQYRVIAEGLSHGDYAPIRKFYGALRAAEALHPGGNTTPPEVHHWRRTASHFLTEAVKDKTMPPMDVYEACDSLLVVVKNNDRQLEEFYRAVEPIIFTNWPSESSLYLIKGTFYKDYAWQARGTAYAREVTESGWTLFARRLDEAEKALAKAWELNPKDERIAREMIHVELGQGGGRDRMEKWFNRAMELNTNYYDACNSKLYYLEPKWYGSKEDLLEFGHECVDSKKWGGRVPLILLDAHIAIDRYLKPDEQKGYWKRPDVWKDVNAAFEKLFALNPNESSYRYNWALYAYRAEQWDVLNRQIPLLGQVNYEYFGGKDEFDHMVSLAKEHARK